MKKYRTYEIETNPDVLQKVTPADVIVQDDGEPADNCVTLKQGFAERLLSGRFKDRLRIIQLHKLSGETKPEIKSILVPFRELRRAISEMEKWGDSMHSFMWRCSDVYLDWMDLSRVKRLTKWPDDFTPGELTSDNMQYLGYGRKIVDNYGNPDMKYTPIERGFAEYFPSFEKSVDISVVIEQIDDSPGTPGRMSRIRIPGRQMKQIMEMIKYWEPENADGEAQ